jgi:hypothetical protein
MKLGVVPKFDSIVAHRHIFYVSSGRLLGFQTSLMLDNLRQLGATDLSKN